MVELVAKARGQVAGGGGKKDAWHQHHESRTEREWANEKQRDKA